MSRTVYELTGCPVCGSSGSVELANRDDMTAERERLWEFHDRRLRPGVPPRNLMDRVAFSQEPPLRLARCTRCSHIYRNPRERAEALAAAYTDDAPDDTVLASLFETQRAAYAAQARRLEGVVGRAGHGIEVGSYAGGFLAAAQDAGWMFDGVDVSAKACAFAEGRGFRVTCCELHEVVVDRAYDAVAIWNTFEQLPDSRAAVDAARRLLRDGGILAIRVPNGSFYARWRKRLHGSLAPIAERLLAHNNLLTFPYRQGFTSRSMTLLLTQGGFDVVSVHGDTLVPIADEWTTALGALDERLVKRAESLVQKDWYAPWVEIYARVREHRAMPKFPDYREQPGP